MKPSRAFSILAFGELMFIAGYFSSPTLWPQVDGWTWAAFGIIGVVAIFAGGAFIGTEE